MGDYQPLQSDGECDRDGVHAARVLHRPGNASVTKQELYYRKTMSPLRKIGFIISLLVCFLTIAVFLWVIPCDWSKCPAKVQQLGWDETLYGLELRGTIQVVQTSRGLNLVSMVRGAIWSPSDSSTRQQQFPPDSGGILCLEGHSGIITWWTRLSQIPDNLACSLLDVDNNGVNDCLVQGEHGYLVAINAESGMKIWKFGLDLGLKPGIAIDHITFPVIIPDVDHDGVNDLAALCRTANSNTDSHLHYLVLISGRTGHILGKPLKITACSDIYNLTLDDAGPALYYTCKRQDSYESEVSKTLSELVTQVMNKTVNQHWPHKPKLKQLSPSETSTDYHVGKHRLSLLNTGRCPHSCTVTVNVTDEWNQTVWSHHADYTYAMNPVLIHFNHTITGFVLKFWHWLYYPHQVSPRELNKTTRLEKIRERVILVTFNASGEPHIVNASQTDVIQLCGSIGCQPALHHQTSSLMIVDLDKDGCQELVSCSVSYHQIPASENDARQATSTSGYELQSKVRVIRLQAELPKLYEAIAHQ